MGRGDILSYIIKKKLELSHLPNGQVSVWRADQDLSEPSWDADTVEEAVKMAKEFIESPSGGTADTGDLKSPEETHEGSNPSLETIKGGEDSGISESD